MMIQLNDQQFARVRTAIERGEDLTFHTLDGQALILPMAITLNLEIIDVADDLLEQQHDAELEQAIRDHDRALSGLAE